MHLCHLGINLFGYPLRRGDYSAALCCQLPPFHCWSIAVWMVLVSRTSACPTAMVREHCARGFIFPDWSWHVTWGPAKPAVGHGCTLSSNRANLRRNHPDDHGPRPDHANGCNWCVARISRRRSDLRLRCPDWPLRDVEFTCSSDRHSVLVNRYGLFPQRSAASR